MKQKKREEETKRQKENFFVEIFHIENVLEEENFEVLHALDGAFSKLLRNRIFFCSLRSIRPNFYV